MAPLEHHLFCYGGGNRMGRGAIYTRNTYNAKGQLTRTQVDAETAATAMAPTLWGAQDGASGHAESHI